MNRKYACYAGLLLTLMTSSALAQTRPKKRVSKPVIVSTPVTERVPQQPEYQYPAPEPREETVAFNPNHVFTYADQMPTLNGQHVVTASVTAIHRYLVVPPNAPDGRVFVQFEVDKEGHVHHARIAKGLRADVDSAVVAATRQLPSFLPGQLGGQAVAVRIMVPVNIVVKKQL